MAGEFTSTEPNSPGKSAGCHRQCTPKLSELCFSARLAQETDKRFQLGSRSSLPSGSWGFGLCSASAYASSPSTKAHEVVISARGTD